jgi:transcriptional regulator with XRE-family HTH domain
MGSKHNDRYREIGQAIQRQRKLKGLTQEELAEKLSISLSYLTKIEAQNCDKPFSLEVLFDIADALDMKVSDLLTDM